MVNRRKLISFWLTEFITIKYIKKKTSYPESLVNVSYFSKFKMKLLELIFFTGVKMKAPKITYDSMLKNEIKKLRETWIKSRKSFKNWLIHWMNQF